MKNIALILTIYLVSTSFSAFSQETEKVGNWCGTTFTEEMMDRVQESTEKYMSGNLLRSRMEYSIPITVHNMRNTDGSGGANVLNFLDFMCDVTEFYAEMGIDLYIETLRNVDNTNWTQHNALSTITWLNDVDNTVNIYLFKTLPPPTGQPGAVLCGYYTPAYDVLALNSSACFNAATTIHELGHFFSLPHTFLGFEGTVAVPASNNCGVFVTHGEKVDGSNCAVEGDRICDTGPDNNSFGGQPCSNGLGCLQYDSDGVSFMPDATNYMSYFSDNCLNGMTDGQEAVMIDHIENVRPNFINTSPLNTNPVAEQVELNSPLNDEEKPFDEVLFSWDAVSNANLYFFEINRLVTFSSAFRIEATVTDEIQYVSNILSPNTTYYWRVMPYNTNNICSTVDAVASGSFRTNDQSVAVEDVEGLEAFGVMPNPATSNQIVTVSVSSKKAMEGQLSLYNVSGQRIHSENIQVAAANNTFNLDVKGLAAGLYVVNIEFAEGTVQQKLVIQ